jgi:hypothetical protein
MEEGGGCRRLVVRACSSVREEARRTVWAGHPFIGVEGRRRRPGRVGSDGMSSFNGAVTEVEGRKCG